MDKMVGSRKSAYLCLGGRTSECVEWRDDLRLNICESICKLRFLSKGVGN